MTKATIVNIQLSRGGVALVIGGALLIAALIGVAGYIAGAASASKREAAPVVR